MNDKLLSLRVPVRSGYRQLLTIPEWRYVGERGKSDRMIRQ